MELAGERRPGVVVVPPLPAPGLALACAPSPVTHDLRLLPHVLGQRLPAESFTATTSLTLSTTTADARAGLVMLGATYRWAGLRHDGDRIVLVCRTADEGAAEVDAVPPVPLRARAHHGAAAGDRGPRRGVPVRGRHGRPGVRPLGPPFTATAGNWIGATVGLFATGPAAVTRCGAAEFDWFRVGPAL